MDYALDGFEVEAVDYLLKPVTRERLDKSLRKFHKWNPHSEEKLQVDYTYFKDGVTLHKVFYEDILYFKSLKDYVKIYLTGSILVIHTTMKNLENILPSSLFIRIHRSYIVAINKIDSFQIEKIRIKEHSLPIGESYKSGVKKIFN
jgi:two-component system LytT family response regulator